MDKIELGRYGLSPVTNRIISELEERVRVLSHFKDSNEDARLDFALNLTAIYLLGGVIRRGGSCFLANRLNGYHALVDYPNSVIKQSFESVKFKPENVDKVSKKLNELLIEVTLKSKLFWPEENIIVSPYVIVGFPNGKKINGLITLINPYDPFEIEPESLSKYRSFVLSSLFVHMVGQEIYSGSDATVPIWSGSGKSKELVVRTDVILSHAEKKLKQDGYELPDEKRWEFRNLLFDVLPLVGSAMNRPKNIDDTVRSTTIRFL